MKDGGSGTHPQEDTGQKIRLRRDKHEERDIGEEEDVGGGATHDTGGKQSVH